MQEDPRNQNREVRSAAADIRHGSVLTKQSDVRARHDRQRQWRASLAKDGEEWRLLMNNEPSQRRSGLSITTLSDRYESVSSKRRLHQLARKIVYRDASYFRHVRVCEDATTHVDICFRLVPR